MRPEAEPSESAGTGAPVAAGDEQGRPGKRRETRQTEPTTRARRDRRRSGERMARLFLRVGKRDGVRPADVVGAIANEAGIPGDEIGDNHLYSKFTLLGGAGGGGGEGGGRPHPTPHPGE